MTRTEFVIATIFRREAFRVWRYYQTRRYILLLSALVMVSLAGNISLLTKSDRFRYFLVNPAGDIVKMVPLDEPNMSNEDIAKWTVDSVLHLYSVDFANYQSQFQSARDRMTLLGWQSFEKAMADSGNMDAIKINKYAVSAAPTGPAEIIKGGIFTSVSGEKRYAWRVRFPMLVTYQSNERRTVSDLIITAVVVRQPENIQKNGLGIRQIIEE